MRKDHAIHLLGGSPSTAAKEVGVSVSAVSQWPDTLPRRLVDRVLAALARKHLPPELLAKVDQPSGEGMGVRDAA